MLTPSNAFFAHPLRLAALTALPLLGVLALAGPAAAQQQPPGAFGPQPFPQPGAQPGAQPAPFGSAPSSVTNTSPCCVGLMVPGSTFR